MQAPELTLAAALRDAASPVETARHKAIRNLAPALLAELDRPGPRWRATDEHPQGAAVQRTLLRAVDDPNAAIAGVAALGAATLGDAAIVPQLERWLALDAIDEDAAFLRECAAMALGYLGACAPPADPISRTLRRSLVQALEREHPELRFQAASSLVDAAGPDAAEPLLGALARETHEEVREGLVIATTRLDPPSAAVVERWASLLGEAPAHSAIAFEAGLGLAGQRRSEGVPPLLVALAFRERRDRALEGLAVLGPAAGPLALVEVARLAERWSTPGVTRVRAAYAWARLVGDAPENPGLRLLRRLAYHPRPAVREAVRDAFAALQRLATA